MNKLTLFAFLALGVFAAIARAEDPPAPLTDDEVTGFCAHVAASEHCAASAAPVSRRAPPPQQQGPPNLCDSDVCFGFVKRHNCFIHCSEPCAEGDQQCLKPCFECRDPPPQPKAVTRREDPPAPLTDADIEDFCDDVAASAHCTAATTSTRFARQQGPPPNLCDNNKCFGFVKKHNCFIHCQEPCAEGDQQCLAPCFDCRDPPPQPQPKAVTRREDPPAPLTDEDIEDFCGQIADSEHCNPETAPISRRAPPPQQQGPPNLCDNNKCFGFIKKHNCFIHCSEPCAEGDQQCLAPCFDCRDQPPKRVIRRHALRRHN